MLRAEQRPQGAADWELAADLALTVSARAFSVDKRCMQEKSRGLKDVAFARQVAMYLMHVTFGGTYQDAGAPLGRERTTVAYACSLVEDCRDEIEFDRKLTMLEESLERLWALAQLKTRRVPVRDQAAA